MCNLRLPTGIPRLPLPWISAQLSAFGIVHRKTFVRSEQKSEISKHEETGVCVTLQHFSYKKGTLLLRLSCPNFVKGICVTPFRMAMDMSPSGANSKFHQCLAKRAKVRVLGYGWPTDPGMKTSAKFWCNAVYHTATPKLSATSSNWRSETHF